MRRSKSARPAGAAARACLAALRCGLCAAGSVPAVAGCGGGKELARPSGNITLASRPQPAALASPVPGPATLPTPAAANPRAAATQPAPMCPEGMVYIDAPYCPKVERRCLDDENNISNRITICHKFAPSTRCLSTPRRQRFCIDKYEYPNQEGAHPPVMVDWYDAAGACTSRGKRLCWESEWVTACEGPQNLPFPYGYSRDPKQCNIDNRWLNPSLDKVYSKKPDVQDAELLRLDQSVASGARAGCVSGFGVSDLTGNFDEWVNAETWHEESKWAGLKGGAWGHVRNACRPMTTSHPPDFTYYFISFRCCADAAPDPDAERDPKLWKPPPQPNEPDPTGRISPGWTPARRGPNQP